MFFLTNIITIIISTIIIIILLIMIIMGGSRRVVFPLIRAEVGRSVWPPSPRRPYTNNILVLIISIINDEDKCCLTNVNMKQRITIERSFTDLHLRAFPSSHSFPFFFTRLARINGGHVRGDSLTKTIPLLLCLADLSCHVTFPLAGC